VLAIQISRPGGGPRRRLEIPQAPRQHLPLRRGRRPAGAGQPEGPPPGSLRAADRSVAALERDDAAARSEQLHAWVQRRRARRPFRRADYTVLITLREDTTDARRPDPLP